LFPDGSYKNQWGQDQSVPDFTQLETKMWFYYAATSYISAGAEAIHFGQVALMASHDNTRQHTWEILSKVRTYASVHARRGFVLCNAHIFQEGWSYQGILLMDFHAFPSRPRDVVDTPQHATLELECPFFNPYCIPFRRSAGGRTVGGYDVDSLPYLVELDNWGVSSTPGQHVPHSDWTWGEDGK
jgi:hypothetical protein